MDFLDEETLFAAEKASITMAQVAKDHGHWPRLFQTLSKSRRIRDFVPGNSWFMPHYCDSPHEQRYHNEKKPRSTSSYSASQKKAAMLRFIGDQAATARKLELKGEQHYNYGNADSQKEQAGKDRKLQSVANPWFCFVEEGALDEDCFVRISRVQSPTHDPLLIAQGFGKWSTDSDYWKYGRKDPSIALDLSRWIPCLVGGGKKNYEGLWPELKHFGHGASKQPLLSEKDKFLPRPRRRFRIYGFHSPWATSQLSQRDPL
ncbi:expressed unknown protein [Seminavis robusta]|uniref:Uncharacterized protein n=1 Tax=Seminavis robusta TaxID=568900 RepID=A0A9N8HQ75_9STRA|nr:expressed unknown protein [Seminavis robusta]|eukprot:Sro1167_g248310.1 n/a (260) ;mRNA; r:2766-3545